MKLKGFSNAALNLGYVDVRLERSTRVDFVTCAACSFTAKHAFYCECNHVYCRDCIYLLAAANESDKDRKARCVQCRSDALVMEISVNEEFIANLRCHCPQCTVTTRLGELREHLNNCDSTPGSLHSSDKRRIVEVVHSPDRVHETFSDTTSDVDSLLQGRDDINRKLYSFFLTFLEVIDNGSALVSNKVDVGGVIFQFAITQSESPAGPRLDIYMMCCSEPESTCVRSVTVSEMNIDGGRPKRVIRSDIHLGNGETLPLGSMFATTYDQSTSIRADFETD